MWETNHKTYLWISRSCNSKHAAHGSPYLPVCSNLCCDESALVYLSVASVHRCSPNSSLHSYLSTPNWLDNISGLRKHRAARSIHKAKCRTFQDTNAKSRCRYPAWEQEHTSIQVYNTSTLSITLWTIGMDKYKICLSIHACMHAAVSYHGMVKFD